MQDLQASAGVTVGHNEKAQMYMIVSPNCAACLTTWREIREAVEKNQIQIKLIPYGAGSAEGEKQAGRLLQSDKPFEAWNKFVEGDKKVLEGEPDAVHLRAAQDNATIVKNWDIRVTPYVVYRSVDQKIKIVQGKPERVAAILTDMPH